jgi:predicted nucleic acid-binding protein
MPNQPRLYWDACVALSYIGKIPDRMPHLRWFLEHAGQEHLLVTSTISVAEVAYAAQEKESGELDPDVENAISALWATDGPIRLQEFHALIGDEGRQLIRQAVTNGWKLTPLDAIHLATARRLGVAVFHTYDEGLKKYEGLINAKIEPPITPTPMLDFDAEAAPTVESPPAGEPEMAPPTGEPPS